MLHLFSSAKEAVSNYRPISLLSLPSKLLDYIVHNHPMSHLLSNNLFSPCQLDSTLGAQSKKPYSMPPTIGMSTLAVNTLLHQISSKSFDVSVSLEVARNSNAKEGSIARHDNWDSIGNVDVHVCYCYYYYKRQPHSC